MKKNLFLLVVLISFASCKQEEINKDFCTNSDVLAKSASQNVATLDELYEQVNLLNEYYVDLATEFPGDFVASSVSNDPNAPTVSNGTVKDDIEGAVLGITTGGRIGGFFGSWIGAGFTAAVTGGIGAPPGYFGGLIIGRVIGAVTGGVVGAVIGSSNSAGTCVVTGPITEPGPLVYQGFKVNYSDPVSSVFYDHNTYATNVGIFHNNIISKIVDLYEVTSLAVSVDESLSRTFDVAENFYGLDIDPSFKEEFSQEISSVYATYDGDKAGLKEYIRTSMEQDGMEIEYQIIESYLNTICQIPTYYFFNYTKELMELIELYEDGSEEHGYSVLVMNSVLSVGINSYSLWNFNFPKPAEFSLVAYCKSGKWVCPSYPQNEESINLLYTSGMTTSALATPKIMENGDLAFFFYEENCALFPSALGAYNQMLSEDYFIVEEEFVFEPNSELGNVERIIVPQGEYPIYRAMENKIQYVWFDIEN